MGWLLSFHIPFKPVHILHGLLFEHPPEQPAHDLHKAFDVKKAVAGLPRSIVVNYFEQHLDFGIAHGTVVSEFDLVGHVLLQDGLGDLHFLLFVHEKEVGFGACLPGSARKVFAALQAFHPVSAPSGSMNFAATTSSGLLMVLDNVYLIVFGLKVSANVEAPKDRGLTRKGDFDIVRGSPQSLQRMDNLKVVKSI